MRTVSSIRTVSTTGGGVGWSETLLRPSARYPPAATPATTTAPTRTPARDLRFGAGSGVVGAAGPVISVGESAVTRARGRAALRPFAGAATGCSGHTAVAKSSIVENRRSGSLDMARATAVARNGGTAAFLVLASGGSPQIRLAGV